MKYLLVESKADAKGRSFRGELLGYVSANEFWEGGSGAGRELIRPVFAMFACSDAEARPFVANLQIGNKAVVKTEYDHDDHKKFEFMKSAKYTFVQQKHVLDDSSFPPRSGVVVTVYLHDLFRTDDVMVDPDEVKFVLVPDREWLAPVKPEVVEHLRKFLWSIDWPNCSMSGPSEARIEYISRVCFLWAKQIMTRTKLPIPEDGRFFAQALAASLMKYSTFGDREERYCGWKREFGAIGGVDSELDDRCGLGSPIATRMTHEQAAEFFAEQVDIFFRLESK